MLKELKQDAETRMGKSVESLKNDLTKIRTGRAHPSLLEHITVDYYGSEVPLFQHFYIFAHSWFIALEI